MSPIDIVDSEHIGLMKSLEGNKIRSQVLREYSLILASLVALHSAYNPIYIVRRGRVELDPMVKSRILDYVGRHGSLSFLSEVCHNLFKHVSG